MHIRRPKEGGSGHHSLTEAQPCPSPPGPTPAKGPHHVWVLSMGALSRLTGLQLPTRVAKGGMFPLVCQSWGWSPCARLWSSRDTPLLRVQHGQARQVGLPAESITAPLSEHCGPVPDLSLRARTKKVQAARSAELVSPHSVAPTPQRLTTESPPPPEEPPACPTGVIAGTAVPRLRLFPRGHPSPVPWSPGWFVLLGRGRGKAHGSALCWPPRGSQHRQMPRAR